MKNNKSFYAWDDFVSDNNKAYQLSQQGKFSEAKPYIDRALHFLGGLVSASITLSDFTTKDYAKVFGMAGFIYGELGDEDGALCLLRYDTAN
ncbi:MAG: hypothetical protein K2M45_01920 [Muribaculaceae bacterium]|nr:hypothetical protein [Muribaculaceae bacterium]